MDIHKKSKYLIQLTIKDLNNQKDDQLLLHIEGEIKLKLYKAINMFNYNVEEYIRQSDDDVQIVDIGGDNGN